MTGDKLESIWNEAAKWKYCSGSSLEQCSSYYERESLS